MKKDILEQMIKERHGSVRKMCEEYGLVYTTVKSSMESDEKLRNMKFKVFRVIAHSLGMTSDELFEALWPEA